MAGETSPATEVDERLANAEERNFRVLVTAGYFSPGWRAGGPVRSISDVLDTASAGVSTILLTRDRDLGAPAAYPGLSGTWARRGRTDVFYLGVRHPAHWRMLWRSLRSARFDLLYVNSVWSVFSVLPIVAARLGLLRAERILVAPRGEFGAAALGLHRLRKRVFLAGWRWMLRGPRVLWHATGPQEVADIRRVLPRARIGVVAIAAGPEPHPAPAELPVTDHTRLVFISRISPMKNLDLVLAALAHVRAPVRLDIYGPVEDPRYWQRCRELWAALPDPSVVSYRGELPPGQVGATFARYDASVLPTRGENFGNAVAESLAAYCPVICSDRTPWTPVLRDGGGQVLTELTSAALGALLNRVASAPPTQRRAARLSAGEAYRRWRLGRPRASVLDLAWQAVDEPPHRVPPQGRTS
ncbi:glycosyltransferase [Micromonospora sp. HM134]|uniref:glycosyltransferase n=1 Tax=unclassified Micromonospora TaxID=2617518 RepID=UPI001198C76A|nr:MULTISPECIES: glycosyltransferase [unclassified Micromonospora]QDY07453.1 glycosyltransferase [Micromonospora sp. HM134]